MHKYLTQVILVVALGVALVHFVPRPGNVLWRSSSHIPPTSSTVPELVNQWKVFSDPEAGLNFAYPSDWLLPDGDVPGCDEINGCVTLSGPEGRVFINLEREIDTAKLGAFEGLENYISQKNRHILDEAPDLQNSDTDPFVVTGQYKPSNTTIGGLKTFERLEAEHLDLFELFDQHTRVVTARNYLVLVPHQFGAVDRIYSFETFSDINIPAAETVVRDLLTKVKFTELGF